MSKDKSELIDEVLGKLDKQYRDNFYDDVDYTEAKATLQKAFREVEIEGQILAYQHVLNLATIAAAGVFDGQYVAKIVNQRLAELTKIKEDV